VGIQHLPTEYPGTCQTPGHSSGGRAPLGITAHRNVRLGIDSVPIIPIAFSRLAKEQAPLVEPQPP
jgi:hypothetical protein